MADKNPPQPPIDGPKEHLTTLIALPLNEDQTAQIKRDTGISVTWVLVQRLGGTLVRNIDPGTVSLTRLTWSW